MNVVQQRCSTCVATHAALLEHSLQPWLPVAGCADEAGGRPVLEVKQPPVGPVTSARPGGPAAMHAPGHVERHRVWAVDAGPVVGVHQRRARSRPCPVLPGRSGTTASSTLAPPGRRSQRPPQCAAAVTDAGRAAVGLARLPAPKVPLRQAADLLRLDVASHRDCQAAGAVVPPGEGLHLAPPDAFQVFGEPDHGAAAQAQGPRHTQ